MWWNNFFFTKFGDSFQKKMRTLQQNSLFLFSHKFGKTSHTKKKKAEEEVLRWTWLIEKMTWKRSLCFNFQLPFHVEMTYVHLNFFIDSEEHWSWKISREVRSLKSESPFDDLEYLSFQILWLHLIGSELELQLETIMWHTRLLRKLCIYFAIGYVVVLIFFNYLFDVTKVCVCWKVFNTNFF